MMSTSAPTPSSPETTTTAATASQGLLARLVQAARLWLNFEIWPQSLALLATRIYLFEVFFRSGLTKIHDWDATLFLFSEEYHVPVLPPELAAYMGTAGELGFSTLLLLGILSRPVAVGLFFVNAVAAISYPDLAPAALKDHYLWGVLAIGLAGFGAGRFSIDAFAWRRWLSKA